MKKNLLIYGAGAIGRGFIPWVFPPEQYEYSYVETNDATRSLLKKRGAFTTYRTRKGIYETKKVPVPHCYNLGEEREAINDADVIIIAVGPRNVLSLASNLKGTRMPIICCENDNSIPKLLASITDNPQVVFAIPDVITSNTAPPTLQKKDPLSVVTEDGICYIDNRLASLKSNAHYIKEKELAMQWNAKLYLHNTPHCISAYLGSILGVTYVHEVMQHTMAKSIVKRSMREMKLMLAHKFHLDESFINWYARKELRRFSNTLLYDPVSRVAREPFRKLEPRERLIGAAQLSLGSGIIPRAILLGIMAAFYYRNPYDSDTNIQYLIRSLSSQQFLSIIMRLTPDEALAQLLIETWEANINTLSLLHGK